MPITITQIWANKQDLTQTKIVQRQLEPEDLKLQEVILKVESLGFSANNITYAVFGDKMGYWGFFPAESGWGIVPMWGFATVLYSKHESITQGEKVFGYLPMASHLRIQADKVAKTHFFDMSDQRKSISPVYDRYLRCAADPSYQVENEAWQLNFRPLFMTSFVLDAYVGQALSVTQVPVKQVIISSASSKTAYGTAHLLKQQRTSRGGDYQIIGLTSEKNVQTCQQLDCYDQVLTYQQVSELNAQSVAWVLDFAGNKSLLLSLQSHFFTHLDKLILIGSTDVQAQQDKPAGHINSEFFFAPEHVKRLTEQWGQAEFSARYAKAWQGFFALLSGNISQQNYQGVEQIQGLYQAGLNNALNSQHMNVLTF